MTKLRNKNQRGSIIVFTLLILAVLMAIGLTLTEIFVPKIRIIAEASNSVPAIFAADSAMEWCLYTNNGKSPAVSPPVMDNESSYTIYYIPGDSESVCPPIETPLNHRAVGVYRNVSRSFQISLPTPEP